MAKKSVKNSVKKAGRPPSDKKAMNIYVSADVRALIIKNGGSKYIETLVRRG